jgi:hypothetical protein
MGTTPYDDDENWYESVDNDGDEDDEDPQGALFWNSPSSVASVAGSDQFLILDGQGAGAMSVTSDIDPEEIRSAPPLLTRDEALDGNAPIFLAHRGGQHHKLLPHALARLHYAHGQNLALGAIIRLPGQTREAGREFFDRCATAAIRIADPICYMEDGNILRLPKEPISPSAKARAIYLSMRESDDWVRQVLDAQREAGANLLLTPGRALDTGNPRDSLKTLFEEAEQAVSLLEREERLALNLTLPARWLSADDLREKLFNELLDREEHEIWFVRVQWPGQRSFTQPANEKMLQGYKRLAELATDENRLLLLPQTGLTGWLMLAFGARGFGVGSSATDQAFVEPSYGRSKGASRKERYFEKQMLHTVERSVHDALSTESDYEECECPYCPTLLHGQAWSHELAGLHSLFSMGCVAAQAQQDSGRGGYRAAVRRMVHEAMRFAQGKDLADTNAPQHLESWDQHL